MKIRFRMWSKKANKYFYDPQVFECLMQQHRHDDCIAGLSHDYVGDGMVFEQYTGLSDRHEQDICEGDIMEEETGYLFQVMWDDKYAKFFLKWRTKAIQYPEWNRGIRMKIAGNIHQNYDLIKSVWE